MAIAFVQKATGASSAAGPLVFSISATGSGNFIAVGLGGYLNGTNNNVYASVTDNAGNSYTRVTSTQAVQGPQPEAYEFWYAKNINAGATAITITGTAALNQTMVDMFEFSGVHHTAPIDTGNFNAAAAGATTSGLVTPSATTNVLISGAISGSIVLTSISTAGWISTAANTVEPQCSGYLLSPAISPQSADYSPATGASHAASILSVIEGPAGPSAKQKSSMFLVM